MKKQVADLESVNAQLRTELGLQRRLHDLGFTTTTQYVRNVVVRGGYRLVPEGVRRMAYRRLVAPYGERGEDTGSRSAQMR